MIRSVFLMLICACVPLLLQAHTIDFSLDRMSDQDVFTTYLVQGFRHILPLGLDHILFIICLFFVQTSLRHMLLQASMFTLAHTITLGLSMGGIIPAELPLVEPVIAFSIVILAVNNIVHAQKSKWHLPLVFLFGLVHGLGFAGALQDLGMPEYAFGWALLAFNLGVELGQIAILIVLYIVVSRPFRNTKWYRGRLVIPVSVSIAFLAGFWTIERLIQ